MGQKRSKESKLKEESKERFFKKGKTKQLNKRQNISGLPSPGPKIPFAGHSFGALHSIAFLRWTCGTEGALEVCGWLLCAFGQEDSAF